ncbi:MAG: M48 family metalloprotease [Gammaproteobacteria bacterium]|nr:M48 family metalloprotease [Gammaproteobacteria bacterium]
MKGGSHLAAGLALSTILLGACTTTTTGGSVGADRSQFMLVSSGELNQLAAQGYADLKSQASQKGALNQNRAMLQRVRTITGRIRPQTRVFRSDAPGWAWEANVISSNQLNAFVMPGGKVMIFSGLIDRLHLSDDEIAIVLGHEIAHALREHSREQVSQALAAQSMIGLGTAIFGLGSGSANLAGAGYQALLATRFSRSHESEADRIGLELSARAGYDPRAGVSQHTPGRIQPRAPDPGVVAYGDAALQRRPKRQLSAPGTAARQALSTDSPPEYQQTEAERQTLENLGGDAIQGYLISRLQPLEQIVSMVTLTRLEVRCCVAASACFRGVGLPDCWRKYPPRAPGRLCVSTHMNRRMQADPSTAGHRYLPEALG